MNSVESGVEQLVKHTTIIGNQPFSATAIRFPRRTRAAAGRRRGRRDAGYREPPRGGRPRRGTVCGGVRRRRGCRFGQTQTEYNEWAVDRLQQHHTTTVTYTGDNNVTYNKTCESNLSDISVQSIEPVYLPEVRQGTEILEYSYPYEYYAAGPSRVTLEDRIHRCVHCETSGIDETYTYCPNCGAIACTSHIETERLEGKPVCTGCAVTERFALKMKHFYDDQNLEALREEYAAMLLREKAMENKLLAGGSVVAALLITIGLLVIGGII